MPAPRSATATADQTAVPPAPPRAPVPVATPQPPVRRVPFWMSLRSRFGPYLLLVPALVPVAIGLGYPLVRQFVISFQEYGLAQQFGRPAEWVGLLLAWGTPVLATMTVWQWLFDSQYGVINWVLAEPLGVEGMRNHSWLIEPLSFYFVATVIVVWMSVPFVVFTVYAGLLQVPAEVEEAAALDGANGWQRFWFLAVPLIKPVLFVVALLQVIWDLRVFTQIYVLQRAGAPTRDTHLLGTYIYSLSKEFSMAGAMATIMLLITLALTGLYIHRMLREEEL